MRKLTKNQKWIALISIVVVLIVVIGIFISLEPEAIVGDSGTNKGISYEYNYDVPKSKPNIFVSKLGYEANGVKTVLFSGEKTPDSFKVVDCVTGNVVYTGKISEIKNSEGCYIGKFNSLETIGEYYIEADYIGQSFPFFVKEDVRKELFREVYFSTTDKLSSEYDIYDKMLDLSMLICAYEYYDEIFNDDTGIRDSGNGIPDLLDNIREQIDKLKKEDVSTLTNNEQAMYVALFAKFSFVYKEFDSKFAKECLATSNDCYDKYNIYFDNEGAETYYAAAELYRQLGTSKYRDIVDKYEDIRGSNSENQSVVFLGDLTYLRTKRRVDTDYCKYLIEYHTNIARENVVAAKSNYEYNSDMDEREISQDILGVVIVEYLLGSKEYSDMILSRIHYISGMNFGNEDFLDEVKGEPEFLFAICNVILEQD